MKNSVFFSHSGQQNVRKSRAFCAIFSLFSVFFFVSSTVHANSYFDMDLESLMNVTITSLSKREEKLRDTAAALYVISADDLRRSGAVRIEEALRMVPGLMVGKNNGWVWSISSRGRSFNPTFENKLLVMVDGQSIYSPVFSGTLWETSNLFIEDIERIEVIRGPGGTTWGSNAVNGIINIITKSSSKTKGILLSGEYGYEEKGSASFRFGDEISPGNFYRVYSSFRKVEERGTDDQFNTRTLGFRTDLTPAPNSSLFLAGDLFVGTSEGPLVYPDMSRPPYAFSFDIKEDLDKYKLSGKYSHEFADGSALFFRAGLIRDQRKSPFINLDVAQYDFDLDYQFSVLENHLIQAGIGYRLSQQKAPSSFEQVFCVFKKENSDNLFSAFLSDTIDFADGKVNLILGSKLEYMKNIGLEFSPNVRLLYKIDEKKSFWASASRTIRTPSYIERFGQYHQTIYPLSGLPVEAARLSFAGQDALKEEESHSLEFGYRFIPSEKFFLDASVYYARYKHLSDASIHFEDAILLTPTIVQLNAELENITDGTVRGGEIALFWSASSWLSLRAWYSFCEDEYEFKGSGQSLFGEMYGNISPRHQFFFRPSFTFPHSIELDFMLRYVSKLSGLGVPAYTTMDARLGFRPTKNVEISLIGKNLLEKRHRESGNSLVYGFPSTLERGFLCSVRVEF